jgi:branched-subunit amino acid aminotransferase/4-amino-4-deoxychorismate lyase
LWDGHVERLLTSLDKLGLPAPERAQLTAAAQRAIARLPDDASADLSADSSKESGLRVSWIAVAADLADPRAWRLDVSVRPIPPLTRDRRSGGHGITLPFELARDTPTLKSTSYFSAVLGLQLAQKLGGNEGLFRAPDGSYTEGTATALVAWDDGRLLQSQHPILPSVTAAAFVGPSVRRGLLSRELLSAGALLLGSLTKATPLLSLDGKACQLPPLMLEKIALLNRQLTEGAVPLPVPRRSLRT